MVGQRAARLSRAGGCSLPCRILATIKGSLFWAFGYNAAEIDAFAVRPMTGLGRYLDFAERRADASDFYPAQVATEPSWCAGPDRWPR